MKSAKNAQWKICRNGIAVDIKTSDVCCKNVKITYYEYIEDFNGLEKNADKRCRELEEKDELNKESERKIQSFVERKSEYSINVYFNEYFYCKTLDYLEEKRKAGYRVIGIKEDSEYEDWTKEQLIDEILDLKSEIKDLKEN